MQQLIECVPNFSEGNDMSVIKQITDEIESVAGARLLNVDPGKATNRTVVTMVGEPQAVIEAAFLAIKKAGELKVRACFGTRTRELEYARDQASTLPHGPH